MWEKPRLAMSRALGADLDSTLTQRGQPLGKCQPLVQGSEKQADVGRFDREREDLQGIMWDLNLLDRTN